MSFLGKIQALDVQLFQTINQSWGSPVWDGLALLLSSRVFWWLIATAFLGYFLVSGQKKLIRVWFLCALSIGVTDLVSYQVLKPAFQRVRPCYSESRRLVAEGCGSRYGFPSNHASNSMAAAVVVMVLVGGTVGWLLFVSGLCVGLSRVYLGVHFPGDVLFGYVVGALCAFVVLAVAQLIKLQSKKRPRFDALVSFWRETPKTIPRSGATRDLDETGRH